MVVDTSAMVAIIIGEDERLVFEDLILRTPIVVMSVVSVVETCIALAGKRRSYEVERLDQSISTLRIDVRPVDDRQGQLARCVPSIRARP
jgi:uncharacterized protein with PIN domain